jgi:hypothetical protein
MILTGVVVLALLGYAFFAVTKLSGSGGDGAGGTGDRAGPVPASASPAPSPPPPPEPFPRAGTVFLGVQTGAGPWDFTDLDAFAKATGVPAHTDVVGVIWFETRKELDWRLSTTPDAAAAFRAGAQSPRYQTAWSTNTYPLESIRLPRRG